MDYPIYLAIIGRVPFEGTNYQNVYILILTIFKPQDLYIKSVTFVSLRGPNVLFS